ncbi:arginine utilization protein RocB [Peribacillus deserti]|uniref:Arginine utilization protein RocB n=1 Tax=Peribacillus deserti TaxID=673318 RepID=A0ABS2QKI1_9BACI|nr:M20/M25/M40 family metallo-hydrolase [Peribacillus deserti]MBM7693666.1 arginine utilization protein RocB [Peribacillus deserti]
MLKESHWNNETDILKIITRLVETPSISGTEQEITMADKIIEIIKEIPYFQVHEDQIYNEPLTNDSLNRKTVAAFFKGKGNSNKTVILLSHFDVVGVEDYGYLKPYAFNPVEYTAKLHSERLEDDVRQDLESGEWLFGRGIMDMKAGLALQIALLSEICLDEGFEGNILLLATPDEERNSEGMFEGIRLLARLKEERGLEYEVCICSEPSFAGYPGDRTKYIYLGSVGKLLPLIFCNGKETHVGEPLEGVNASWMAASFTNKMELSTHFKDEAGGERNPRPTCLKLSDLKDVYNVQTPTDAYVLYNILTLQQSPQDVIEKLLILARECSDEIYTKMSQAYYEDHLDSGMDKLSFLKPRVYTYSDLYKMGQNRHGEEFEASMAKLINKETSADLDYRQLSVEIARGISSYFPDLAPYYLIMFAPPYYPHVHLDRSNSNEEKLFEMAEEIKEYARYNFGEEIKLKTFFEGLSDVSYCRLLDADEIIPSLEKEMPLYGKGYNLPLHTIKDLNIPTINIGPYGKDAHKRTERLELPFSLKAAPALLKYAVLSVLKGGVLHGK